MRPSHLIPALLILMTVSAAGQSNASPAKPRHCSLSDNSGKQIPYPEALRGSGIEGTVILEAVIDEKGCTEAVSVVQKLNPTLDQLARQTVESWQFPPAKKDGKPARVMVRIHVDFKDTGS